MLKIFSNVKDSLKPKIKDHYIDNWVFQLHYRTTTVLFFIATILVTSREYIGEGIRCVTSDNNVKKDDKFVKVVESFCFFTSTFTVVTEADFDDDLAIPYPGVRPLGVESTQPVKHHFYYQWVPFLLFGQAIMFYLPHLLWKTIEGKRITRLVAGLHYSGLALLDKEVQVADQTIPNKENQSIYLKKIKQDFLQRLSMNKFWALWLIMCEMLNVLNVLLQAHIIHRFIGNRFYSLGFDVLENTAVLNEIFPKVTKCTFHKYGPSGSIQNHDALCILALNIINEKIYVFFWFWLVFLFAVSCLMLVWRLLTVLLHSRSAAFNRMVFGGKSRGKLRTLSPFMVARKFNYGSWLLLKYLAKNMHSLAFEELFWSLSDDMNGIDPSIKQEIDDEANLLKLH